MAIPRDLATSASVLMQFSTPSRCSTESQEHCATLKTAPSSWTNTDCRVCTVVLWSENGDLKNVVMISVRVWVTAIIERISKVVQCFLDLESGRY